MNREFGAFLTPHLGRQVMTQNKLSIHVESGDIFYENHNIGENLKLDDVEKYDLYAHKNWKYLFYRFNDFIKTYGNPRQKIKHTRKMLDSVGIQKMEEKSKQFLVEKLIHGIEFKNPYKIETEKKPEIIQTVEHNYEIVRRVYQQLWADISELFAEISKSINPLKLHNMSEDIKANGWGIKKITDVNNAEDFIAIFQTATVLNIKEREEPHARNAYNIRKGRLFVLKTGDPLDEVIDILDDEFLEHKKQLYPYVPPQVQKADEIEKETRLVDHEFTKLKTKYDQMNDVATEQKKQERISDLVTDIIYKDNPYQHLSTEDIWIEDDMFYQNYKGDIVNISRDILKNIEENDPFLDYNIPTDVVIEELFDDVDLTSDDETTEEVTIEDVTDDETNNKVTLEDVTDDKSFVVNNGDFKGPEEIDAKTAIVDWDPKNTTVSANTRPRTYMVSKYNSAIRAANKLKNKYKKKIIGKKKPDNDDKLKKTSSEWLKSAGSLETEDQKSMDYIYVSPKGDEKN